MIAASLYEEVIALLVALVILGAVCGAWLMAKAAINTARAAWRWVCWLLRGACRG